MKTRPRLLTNLVDAGHAFEQHVSARYHGNDRALDHVLLTDYVSFYLLENVFALYAEFFYVSFRYHFFVLLIFKVLFFWGMGYLRMLKYASIIMRKSSGSSSPEDRYSTIRS